MRGLLKKIINYWNVYKINILASVLIKCKLTMIDKTDIEIILCKKILIVLKISIRIDQETFQNFKEAIVKNLKII